jgi:threonylcarbamoyladenosine tRNA methylthiotransferase MtaB
MDVVADVRSALKGGAQEVVLTGVHLGSWGHDFEQPMHLRQLVEKILEINEVPRLRLSSLEPWDLDVEFFDLWSDPRLCRHLHLPLQSGCASTLRRMARKTTPESFREVVAAARQRIPGVAITTDVIVGFPGETDAEFAKSLDFVKAINFAGGHVFTYSARPDTAAARMPNQVHNYTRKERSAAMRAVLEAADLTFRQQFVGTQQAVLWETVAGMGADYWELHGLTDNYLRVVAKADRDVWNQITTTHLTAIENGSLRGEIAFVEQQI